MWNQVDTPASEARDVRFAHRMLTRNRLIAQLERIRLINLPTDQAVFRLTETDGIRQFRLRHLDTAANISQQSVQLTHLLHQNDCTSLRMNRIADPKLDPLDRRIGRRIQARFTGCSKDKSYLVPRYRLQNTKSKFRFCFTYPALSDLKVCHRPNVNEGRAVCQSEDSKSVYYPSACPRSAVSQRQPY